jgi:hypothetical protein
MLRVKDNVFVWTIAMDVAKNIGLLVLLSLVTLLLSEYVAVLPQLIVSTQRWFSSHLTIIFSDSSIATLIRQLLATLILPFLVGCVPAGVYWVTKHKHMPHLMWIIWITWIMQTTALLMMSTVSVV